MNTTTNTVHHQTPCAGAVLAFFGVEGVTWNDRTKANVWQDTLRRNGFSVRSRMSKLGKKARVGSCRKALAAVAEKEPSILAFVVRVEGHVLIVGRDGTTVVDTDSRKRDKRQVVGVVAIMKSAGIR